MIVPGPVGYSCNKVAVAVTDFKDSPSKDAILSCLHEISCSPAGLSLRTCCYDSKSRMSFEEPNDPKSSKISNNQIQLTELRTYEEWTPDQNQDWIFWSFFFFWTTHFQDLIQSGGQNPIRLHLNNWPQIQGFDTYCNLLSLRLRHQLFFVRNKIDLDFTYLFLAYITFNARICLCAHVA